VLGGIVWTQRWCECGAKFSPDDRHKKCHNCRKRRNPPSENDAPPSPQLQLAHNASKLMTMLPKHSHHRAPLLSILSDNIPSSAAAGLLHSSASYIRDCKRQDPSSSDLLTQRYQPNTKRQRLAPDQLDAVFSFLASTCSPVSGTAGPFRQFIKDEELYQQYLDSRPVGQSSTCSLERICGQCYFLLISHLFVAFASGVRSVSEKTFLCLKRWMRVRHAGSYFGQFDCYLCLRWKQLPQEMQRPADLQRSYNLAMEYKKCEQHQKVRSWQRQQYQQMRGNLKPRQLLLLMDFTSFSLHSSARNGDDQTVYTQDLIIVLEYIENGRRFTEYLDYLCDSDTNKHDFFFVFQVFTTLFPSRFFKEAFDSIDIWSDGGPHHFKTRFCQWTWHFLSSFYFNNKRICHHFFASYHGHSLADAHAATDKRILRAAYNASQHDRKAVTEERINFGPSSAEELEPLFQISSSRSFVYCIPHINRDPELRPPINPLSLIKSKHCFVYENGTCRAFELTNEGEGQLFSFRLQASASKRRGAV
jgi:hypothetical protein